MREILFRGAQKVDGSKSLYWYEGSLVSEKDGYIGEVEYYIQNESGSFLVIPETVGQYTGLTDKNGNKIFEGDIVITKTTSYKFVGCILYSTEYVRFVCLTKSKISYPMDSTFEYEIIGNIHDNPELLKELNENE